MVTVFAKQIRDIRKFRGLDARRFTVVGLPKKAKF